MLKRLGVTTLLLVVSGLLVCGALSRALAKKPQRPPINYEITWLGSLTAFPSECDEYDPNLGMAVGHCLGDADGNSEFWRAFVYYTDDAIMQDLNDIAPVPEGMVAVTVRGLNGLGQITGSVWDPVAGEYSAYFCDLLADSFVFEILPEVGDGHHYGWGINDQGDIAANSEEPVTGEISTVLYVLNDGVYEAAEIWPGYSCRGINNAGHIMASGGYFYTPDGGWERPIEGDCEVRGMNDDGGYFSGRALLDIGKKRPRYEWFACRYILPVGGGEVAVEPIAQGFIVAGDINNSGDVVFRTSMNTYEHGTLDLDDLLVGTREDLDKWRHSYSIGLGVITERDDTGFGHLAGYFRTGDFGRFGEALILTPAEP